MVTVRYSVNWKDKDRILLFTCTCWTAGEVEQRQRIYGNTMHTIKLSVGLVCFTGACQLPVNVKLMSVLSFSLWIPCEFKRSDTYVNHNCWLQMEWSRCLLCTLYVRVFFPCAHQTNKMFRLIDCPLHLGINRWWPHVSTYSFIPL